MRTNNWLTSAVTAAIATIVVIAASGFAFIEWGMPKAQTYFTAQFATIDAKLEKNSATIAAKLARSNSDTLATIKKLPSLEAITKILQARTKDTEAVRSIIQKTNDTLAGIQKQNLSSAIKARLALLDAKLDKAATVLAVIQAQVARNSNARTADQAARDAELARIEKDIDAVKAEIAANATQTRLKNAVKLDAVQASLATINNTAETLSARISANAAALDKTHKTLAELQAAVKDGFAGSVSSPTQLKDTVARPSQAPMTASVALDKKIVEDLVVFQALPSAISQRQARKQQPPATVAILPKSVHFEKIGGLDDDGQIEVIAKKLSTILKERKGCTVAVAGHADTLGSDDENYALSKQRAEKVVAKLKSAFTGETVKITETAWGERRLQEWTPDETPDVTNRRVDILVRCAGG